MAMLGSGRAGCNWETASQSSATAVRDVPALQLGLRRLGTPCCPSLRKMFLFPPSSGPGRGAGCFLHRGAGRVGEPCMMASKYSLTTGRHASCARFDAGEGSKSFHVVRHEHPTIFVVNRQTHETYRFTIGDDVARVGVGPPSDLGEARRTAIAFLAQRERESPPR